MQPNPTALKAACSDKVYPKSFQSGINISVQKSVTLQFLGPEDPAQPCSGRQLRDIVSNYHQLQYNSLPQRPGTQQLKTTSTVVLRGVEWSQLDTRLLRRHGLHYRYDYDSATHSSHPHDRHELAHLPGLEIWLISDLGEGQSSASFRLGWYGVRGTGRWAWVL